MHPLLTFSHIARVDDYGAIEVRDEDRGELPVRGALLQGHCHQNVHHLPLDVLDVALGKGGLQGGWVGGCGEVMTSVVSLHKQGLLLQLYAH